MTLQSKKKQLGELHLKREILRAIKREALLEGENIKEVAKQLDKANKLILELNREVRKITGEAAPEPRMVGMKPARSKIRRMI